MIDRQWWQCQAPHACVSLLRTGTRREKLLLMMLQQEMDLMVRSFLVWG